MAEDQTEINRPVVAAFMRALADDRLCLHPTDGLPGLGFNPTGSQGFEALLRFKKRPMQQAVLGLVSSAEQAFQFWEPLPHPWSAVLQQIWPAPLTVIWNSVQTDWTGLLGPGGTLALRVPHFAPDCWWMQGVLEQLPYPFPSTSVNVSGESPCVTYDDACRMVQGVEDIHIPEWNPLKTDGFERIPIASTLIQIQGDGTYRMLRPGLVTSEDINDLLRSFA